MRILMGIFNFLGYFFLWIGINGLYEGIRNTSSLSFILQSIWLALLLGILFRWISLKGRENKQKTKQVLDDLSLIFIIRGGIGVFTLSFVHGGIFIITGVIGLLILKLSDKSI